MLLYLKKSIFMWYFVLILLKFFNLFKYFEEYKLAFVNILQYETMQ